MKKTLFYALFILVFVLALSSCQGGGEPQDPPAGDEEQTMNLLDYDLAVICESSNMGAFSAAFELCNELRRSFDLSLNIQNENYNLAEYEIVIGNLQSRIGDNTGFTTIKSLSNPRIGVMFMSASVDRLLIGGSDDASYLIAIDKLKDYINSETGSLDVPTSLDYTLVYDAAIYRERGEIVEYSSGALESLAALSEITVGGKRIPVNSTGKNLSVKITYPEAYPQIDAVAAVGGSGVSITQANMYNGGVAEINVTSKDGLFSTQYNVVFDVQADYLVASEVLLKGGKRGTVTFVVDDGVQSTAAFVAKEMGAKYSNLTASFGVVTTALVNLETETVEGTTRWKIDENGKYVYTPIASAWAFWEDLLSDTRFEAISHSHTHSYWGDDDEGGSYVYKKNDGTWATSEVFPSGNVTKELAASQQILQALGQSGLTFVKPGVGARLSQYYFDMLNSGKYYIGARNTAYDPTNPKNMLNYVSDFKDNAKRYNVKGYMVQHFEVSETVARDATTEECLASDVTYWKDYIDAALEEGAWACFCIHNIYDDTYNAANSGHFIYKSQADKIFGYADGLADELWIASYTDAAIYYNQLSSASIMAMAHLDEYIDVTLVHEETGDCYDMAMTVKVAISDSWEGAELSTGESLTVYENEDGSKYVQLDVVPGETVRICAAK